MSNPLVAFFEKKYPLSAEEKKAIEQLPLQNLKKGEYLQQAGQYSNYCYFIIQGCVREYFLIEGEEKTTNFYTEFQVIFDPETFSGEKPVKQNLVCLEDTILTYGTPEMEEEMMSMLPGLEKVGKQESDDMIASQNKKANSFIIMTPEERYLDLLENRPELVNRVPQYQLASFLGIQPESLSRIKKRIHSKGKKSE